MSHRVKCPECNSCMSPSWPNGTDRLYYCSLCRQWYGTEGKTLIPVENPNQDKIEDSKKILDPRFEEE